MSAGLQIAIPFLFSFGIFSEKPLSGSGYEVLRMQFICFTKHSGHAVFLFITLNLTSYAYHQHVVSGV